MADSILSFDPKKYASGKLSAPLPSAEPEQQPFGLLDAYGSLLGGAAKTLYQNVAAPFKGLAGLAQDPDLLQPRNPVEVALPGGPIMAGAVRELGGQVAEGVKGAAAPGISPIERISSLLSAVPLVGPASTAIGMKLGQPLAGVVNTGRASPNELRAAAEGVGDIAGNIATPYVAKGARGMGRGLGAVAGDAGELLAKFDRTSKTAQRIAAEKAAAAEAAKPTPVQIANTALGVDKASKFLKRGRDPGGEAVRQGVMVDLPPKLLDQHLEAKISEAVKASDAIRDQLTVSVTIDKIQDALASLDKPLAAAKRIGDKATQNRIKGVRKAVLDEITEPVPGSKGVRQLKPSLTGAELKTLMDDVWTMEELMGGKRFQKVAGATSKTWGKLNELNPPELRDSNLVVRNLVAAKQAHSLKMERARGEGVPKAPTERAQGRGLSLEDLAEAIPPYYGLKGRIARFLVRRAFSQSNVLSPSPATGR